MILDTAANKPLDKRENIRARNSIYVFFFLLYLASAVTVSLFEPYPVDMDERAHYSYVRHSADVREIFTDHDASFLLEKDSPSEWSATSNYLSHPSLYYLSLGIFLDITGENPAHEIALLRSANVFLSASAIALLFLLGARLFNTPLTHLVYAASISMLPKMAIVGGIINNDNLALFGAACAFLGMQRFLKGRMTPGTAILTGSGFALAALAKLTAGLSIGLMVLFAHASQFRRFQATNRKGLLYTSIIFIFVFAGILPYLVNLLTIGKPIYIDDAAYALPYLEYQLNLNTIEFIQHFFRRLVEKWAAYEPSNIFQILSFFLLLFLAMIGLLRCFSSKPQPRPLRLLIASSLSATLIMLLIHIHHLHDMYFKTGHLGGATVRYYIPVWPAIAMAAASGLEVIPGERARSYLAILLFVLLLSSTALFIILWHHYAP
jgi:4-amino-4-deoxy-L-arabinose transferase-like glycosyltransferase